LCDSASTHRGCGPAHQSRSWHQRVAAAADFHHRCRCCRRCCHRCCRCRALHRSIRMHEPATIQLSTNATAGCSPRGGCRNLYRRHPGIGKQKSTVHRRAAPDFTPPGTTCGFKRRASRASEASLNTGSSCTHTTEVRTSRRSLPALHAYRTSATIRLPREAGMQRCIVFDRAYEAWKLLECCADADQTPTHKCADLVVARSIMEVALPSAICRGAVATVAIWWGV
jgi:hypothetical protein